MGVYYWKGCEWCMKEYGTDQYCTCKPPKKPKL